MSRRIIESEILFYSPNRERAERWITLLKANGIDFAPVRWCAGMAASNAELAIVALPPEELFRSQRNLKAVFTVAAGIDAILKLKSLPAGVQVVRLEDSGMAAKMSEYVVHAISDISRGMDRYRVAHRERKWTPDRYEPFEHWPVGVMGLGVIGSRIAATVAAMGYPVNAWSRSSRELPGVRCYSGAALFGDFVSGSRVLVNVLPLTEQTRNILGKDTFRRLPAGSVVINVGRGEHLDEKDLIEYLDNGKITAAVLDVFRTEPLPVDHPFWSHPGIRITPHISGTTDEHEAINQIARNIEAFRAGGAMTGVVDRARGY